MIVQPQVERLKGNDQGVHIHVDIVLYIYVPGIKISLSSCRI